MRARPLVLLLLLLAIAQAWARHVQDDIRTGAVLSRGVNLGAWLIIEHFMTQTSPIWWQVPADKRDWGEYTAMQLLGHAVADPLIKAHRDSWITEDDIKEIASYGLNTVRVPVGCLVDWTDDWRVFTPGSLAYLDRLINEWAVTHNVAVLVDIHAAKGSQNGNDNSSPVTKGESHFTNNANNVFVTITTAQFLVNRYAASPAFLGLELLNEPTFDPKQVHTTDETKLKLYYTSAYPSLRSICGNCVLLMSPFLSEQYESFGHKWANVLPPHRNNWIDWHKYLIWGFEN
ncbi:hypothetical protein SDRG_17307 [Saprolegnia diclina VS20]|uniref:glucan 1,3-beta-glucosidase n=1 Tax=Saprolegnia diclina (strain VS20) TaxID=1156394 RepID=T0PUW3_SAPDV|nr:hypothetical protein SDRG_17307 [Saprolegnia diclina VS20]EQC24800.1 hypothetical protein SDRG_17307 [Saprolegnia diclina VS20]|eukprot:XP_008621770.1 hypothetical protein SDRG_17307 [Saprolegnia diclina VS20]